MYEVWIRKWFVGDDAVQQYMTALESGDVFVPDSVGIGDIGQLNVVAMQIYEVTEGRTSRS